MIQIKLRLKRLNNFFVTFCELLDIQENNNFGVWWRSLALGTALVLLYKAQSEFLPVKFTVCLSTVFFREKYLRQKKNDCKVKNT